MIRPQASRCKIIDRVCGAREMLLLLLLLVVVVVVVVVVVMKNCHREIIKTGKILATFALGLYSPAGDHTEDASQNYKTMEMVVKSSVWILRLLPPETVPS